MKNGSPQLSPYFKGTSEAEGLKTYIKKIYTL